MSKVIANSKTNKAELHSAINAAFAAGTDDKTIVAELGATKGTVKAMRMSYNAEVKAAAKLAEANPEATIVKPVVGIVAEVQVDELTPPTLVEDATPVVVEGASKADNKLATMMAATAAKKKAEAEKLAATPVPEAGVATDTSAPVKVKATREKREPKDLTKRDVTAVVSHSLKVIYMCTTLKYSGVGATRAGVLLVKDLEARAKTKPKNEQDIMALLAAEDCTCEILLTQGEETAAQMNKLKNHMKFEELGYTMLSSKGRGKDVAALLAKIKEEEKAKVAETPAGTGVTVTA